MASPRLDKDVFQGVLDFGELTRGEAAVRAITLRNAGDAPLVIRRVYVSGPTGEWKLSSHVVLAGESEELTIKVRACGPVGPTEWHYWILTGDPDNRMIEVTAKATVRGEVECAPSPIRFSGKPLSVDLSAELIVRMPPAVKLLRASSTSSDIAVGTARSLGVDGDKEVYEVPVTVTGTKEIGPFRGEITIETTSDIEPRIVVPVEGLVVSDNRLDCELLSFGCVDSDKPCTRTLRWQSCANPPRPITRVESKYGIAKASAQAATAGSEGAVVQSIEVRIETSEVLAGSVWDEVRLFAGDDTEPISVLPVSAYITKPVVQ